MKTNFYGYYPPTVEQYERLWQEGLIVLDTNVLLNLYRLPTTARDELINVLELLKDRLWIPHQVALEFQRRRLTVIASERKATEEALTATSDLVADIKKRVDALQIDKRGLGIESQPLLTELETANNQLLEAIKTTHNAQLDISASDPVRERLDLLLNNRVGTGPTSQADLDNLVVNGEDRYKEKIPPGFADADKDKNPNEASFIFDHIKYQRKYGDLILWRQLIQHVKDTNTKSVLLVTADRKEDWWWREQGKTIGPHPELVREIQREGAVELFWMYSSVQFVEHANKYSSASVSNESVAEIKQVALSSPTSSANVREFLGRQLSALIDPRATDLQERYLSGRMDQREIESCVERWLERRGELVESNPRGFPDFLVRSDDDAHGYEVKYLRQFDRMLVSPSVVTSMLRGYMETKEGRLSGFTLVIAISEEDFFDILHTERKSELHRRLGRLLRKYPIDGIVIGAVVDDDFQVLAHQQEPARDEDDFL
ncbi:hypothetical protein GO613_22560 [Azoarcus communis]|uniref:PIN-like domain-containing protein n=1 Tax=Parazoarcus communis TaxID=41977 RepID=UPI0014598BE0|nr:PIN-like domain-containing protein [Parazoarcus communis]NMG50879.1 hypothetical protein [Parazoarcus communis]